MSQLKEFTCSKCGEFKQIEDTLSTGYSYTYDEPEQPICYSCIAKDELAQLESGESIWMYMRTNDLGTPISVGNWPGSLRFKTYGYKAGHNWYGVNQFYAWFNHNGATYMARMASGGRTELCKVRKLKLFDPYAPNNPDPIVDRYL